MPLLTQRFSSDTLYLSELERISKRWVARQRPDYSDLKDAGLLPRGL